MKTKIIFIINSIQNPRCIKRVNEFIDNGYDVLVYAFNRGNIIFNENIHFKVNILDAYSNDLSYTKRIPILYKSIRSLVANNKNELYYIFGLEVAMIFKIVAFKQKYIYEESDLVHTYLSNNILRKIFEKIDKYIITKSFMTIFTSEGFRKYHFGDMQPNNCYVIANRLAKEIKECPIIPKIESQKLRIGFVGKIRFNSVRSFAEIFCKERINSEMHFFGNFGSFKEQEMFASLNKYVNCFFHGSFKNPNDLPHIYSQIDLVLSTYDVIYDNVRYAEPNKIYESVYFETPIIVSDGCYLAEKVRELNIGFTVNPLDTNSVLQLINSLTFDKINETKQSIKQLGRDYAINDNELFFQKLRRQLTS